MKKLGIKSGFSSSCSESKNKVIWTIHADNSGSPENQHFVKNISSAAEDVDVLLASPSLCTGVDIQGDRFDEVYGFLMRFRYRLRIVFRRYTAIVNLYLYISGLPHVRVLAIKIATVMSLGERCYSLRSLMAS
ncbi:MAG: hypothetical protein HC930_13200 [Hydrococcus sp. SU_1_0]|nr:hypothetical protein [Hydrococcus sp. SU_1_0]